jgi:hypothetical protein
MLTNENLPGPLVAPLANAGLKSEKLAPQGPEEKTLPGLSREQKGEEEKNRAADR